MSISISAPEWRNCSGAYEKGLATASCESLGIDHNMVPLAAAEFFSDDLDVEEAEREVLRRSKVEAGPEWIAPDLPVLYDRRCRCHTWGAALKDILGSVGAQDLQQVFGN